MFCSTEMVGYSICIELYYTSKTFNFYMFHNNTGAYKQFSRRYTMKKCFYLCDHALYQLPTRVHCANHPASFIEHNKPAAKTKKKKRKATTCKKRKSFSIKL